MSHDHLKNLLEVMAKLRDPETGCVWDKAQTYQSIVPHTLEEAYEVAETIETGDLEALPGELGDLLFQVVFYAQIAKEEGRFDFDDICKIITEKMIKRHPHVFSDTTVDTVEEQSRLWEAIKKEERNHQKADVRESVLDGISLSLSPLLVANKLQARAASVGYDWPDIQGPLDKLDEELEEVKHAIAEGSEEEIKDEIGDLLFCAVNIARHMKIDPNVALRHANRKFIRRFKGMETLCVDDQQVFEELSLDEMEDYWRRVKREQE
jgi:ATP diphosphatase